MKKVISQAGGVVSVVLGLVILAVIVTTICITVIPDTGDKFTEFYILGLEGKADSYPKDLMVGEEARVIAGIVNHEYEELSYQLAVMINGVTDKRINPIVLGHEEKWEQEVSFTPLKAGENEKVEFVLYKYGETEPYRTLHLWIDVKE